jgi:exopolysaccharide biosynthesis protein
MIATDGGSFNGPRMKYIVKTLMNYGVYNAANMDGGYSSQMVVNGKNYTVVNDKMGIVTTSGRRVVNGWGVIDND